jgi:hypothetical protein
LLLIPRSYGNANPTAAASTPGSSRIRSSDWSKSLFTCAYVWYRASCSESVAVTTPFGGPDGIFEAQTLPAGMRKLVDQSIEYRLRMQGLEPFHERCSANDPKHRPAAEHVKRKQPLRAWPGFGSR